MSRAKAILESMNEAWGDAQKVRTLDQKLREAKTEALGLSTDPRFDADSQKVLVSIAKDIQKVISRVTEVDH